MKKYVTKFIWRLSAATSLYQKLNGKTVFIEQSRFPADDAFQVTSFADSNLINPINPVFVVVVCVEMWSSFNLMLFFLIFLIVGKKKDWSILEAFIGNN